MKHLVGIIGFGVFGRFMAQQLSPHLNVMTSSRRATESDVAAVGAQLVPFEDIAQCDYVIPSVPVQNLESVLKQLAPTLRSGSLVVDVSSVKVIPIEIMKRVLPNDCDILATHPLFGPQSGANGIAGLPMVLCPVRLPDERYAEIKSFLAGELELNIIETSPQEHDRQMAYVHALTYLVGRAFHDIDIPDTPLKTATYAHLLEVRRLVEADTPELFETIQHYNPYAAEMRQRFVGQLDAIESELEG